MNLITGTTGLVGACLLEKHVAQGIPVRALIRKEEDKNRFTFDTSEVEWSIGDVLDIVSLKEAMKGIEYVFHCAAVVSFGSKGEAWMYKVNIEGTANVVNACMQYQVKKLCHVSSIAALGQGTKDKPLNEKKYFNESKTHSAYGFTKYYAELEVWRGIEEGLKAVIVNPSIILGPGDWYASSSKLFKYVWDEHSYYIDGGYDFIDVRDVVDQMMNITYSDVVGESYVLSGSLVAYKDLFHQIAKAFKKKEPSKAASQFQMRMLLLWSNVRSFISGADPLITKDAINKAGKFPFLDNSKVQKDFPLEYHSIEDTVSWTCEQLKNRYQRSK